MTTRIEGNTMLRTSSPGSNVLKGKGSLRTPALALLFALGTLLPGRVWAWDRITSGRVGIIQVNSSGSFGLQLAGVDRLCSVTPDGPWAWFDGNWGSPYTIDGQKAILGTLQAAKLSGSTVWVFADLGPDGYCRIGVVNLM